MRPVPTSGSASPAAGTVVRTQRVPPDGWLGAGRLLDLLPAGADTVAWVRGRDGVVGWGVAAREEFTGPERFSRAMNWWHGWLSQVDVIDPVGLPGTGPVAFGSFAFDPRPGTSVVVVPAVVIGRRGDTTWLTTLGPVDAVVPPRVPPLPPDSVGWRQGTRDEASWGASVRSVVERIDAGEVDKVVLARDLVADVEGPIDERFLLDRLHLDYPQCWTFCVAGLVGATPELLIRRDGDLVASRVLAGTVRRDAAADDAAADAAAAALLASDKDLTEHAYAVTSVAEALATHCTDLQVPPSPTVLRLANVQHLATDVTAHLADGASALALAASLHPTAAVCGTPTERALALIRSEEGMDRGRYAGPVGWFDMHGDGELGIALRCGEIDHAAGTLRIFAGCGLVAGSTPEAEIAESAAKFSAMRSALAPSSAPGA